MSERGTFVSESVAYAADSDALADELLVYLKGFDPVLIESHGKAYAVAGVARSSWGGGEWEDFAALPPFAHDISVLIFCESGQAIRFNLKTGVWDYV